MYLANSLVFLSLDTINTLRNERSKHKLLFGDCFEYNIVHERYEIKLQANFKPEVSETANLFYSESAT